MIVERIERQIIQLPEIPAFNVWETYRLGETPAGILLSDIGSFFHYCVAEFEASSRNNHAGPERFFEIVLAERRCVEAASLARRVEIIEAESAPSVGETILDRDCLGLTFGQIWQFLSEPALSRLLRGESGSNLFKVRGGAGWFVKLAFCRQSKHNPRSGGQTVAQGRTAESIGYTENWSLGASKYEVSEQFPRNSRIFYGLANSNELT